MKKVTKPTRPVQPEVEVETVDYDKEQLEVLQSIKSLVDSIFTMMAFYESSERDEKLLMGIDRRIETSASKINSVMSDVAENISKLSDDVRGIVIPSEVAVSNFPDEKEVEEKEVDLTSVEELLKGVIAAISMLSDKVSNNMIVDKPVDNSIVSSQVVSRTELGSPEVITNTYSDGTIIEHRVVYDS